MALIVGSTVVNVGDIPRAIKFWSAALGYVVRDGDETFVVLKDPTRPWSNLSLQLTDVRKSSCNRLHLDLYANDQEVEVARLERLGAKRIQWSYGPDSDFVVMADPDGNEFCIIAVGTQAFPPQYRQAGIAHHQGEEIG